MKNFVQKGEVVTLAAPYDRTSGQGALVGQVFGVAAFDVLSGVNGEFQVEGVFDIAKASGSVSQGDKIYWDNSAKVVTTTQSGNCLVGMAVQAQASGDATARVRLEPQFQPAATVAAIATADASDLATSEALANATKASVNAILVALKAAGLMK